MTRRSWLKLTRMTAAHQRKEEQERETSQG